MIWYNFAMSELPGIKPDNPIRLQNKEIDSPVAGVSLQRASYEFSDGKRTQVTVIRPSSSAKIALEIDPRFPNNGIQRDNQRLISQPGTKSSDF